MGEELEEWQYLRKKYKENTDAAIRLISGIIDNHLENMCLIDDVACQQNTELSLRDNYLHKNSSEALECWS